jgi:hypothetical protein
MIGNDETMEVTPNTQVPIRTDVAVARVKGRPLAITAGLGGQPMAKALHVQKSMHGATQEGP